MNRKNGLTDKFIKWVKKQFNKRMNQCYLKIYNTFVYEIIHIQHVYNKGSRIGTGSKRIHTKLLTFPKNPIKLVHVKK